MRRPSRTFRSGVEPHIRPLPLDPSLQDCVDALVGVFALETWLFEMSVRPIACTNSSTRRVDTAWRRLWWPLDDNYDGWLGFAEADVINVPPRSRGNIGFRQAGH